MAKKRTKEQYAAHATKQRERDAKRREDPAEREKDRIRMKVFVYLFPCIGQCSLPVRLPHNDTYSIIFDIYP